MMKSGDSELTLNEVLENKKKPLVNCDHDCEIWSLHKKL